VLIEDNSHGHGGKYRDQLLGTFGKIGFSSPRKVLGVSTGGILYFNGSIKQSVNKLNLPKISIPLYKQYFQAISLKFPRLKSDFKSRFFPRPEFENPNSFREPMINDYFINDKSLQLINNVNWDKLSKDRRKIYYLWENLAFENGLEPAFQSLSSKSSPWCYPCYVKNPKDVISWFNWGWENGYKVFSWPTLPVEIINADSLAIERWKRLICFSTNNRIQHLDSIHIKSSMLT